MSDENETESTELFSGDEKATQEASFDSIVKPIDRPRGILSPTDRDYLCDLKEYDHHQTELNRQQVIRERITEALRDFDLLWLLLNDSEIDKIVDSFETEELDTALSSIVAFIYIGLDGDIERLKKVFEQGIYEAANYEVSSRWSGGANEVSVDIDIDRHPDVDKLYNRFKTGEGMRLTPAEIGSLVQAGKLDSRDLEELETTKSKFPSVSSGALERNDNDS
jgi:hypothetical protein